MKNEYERRLKTMKKIIALLMTLALVISVLAVPALAEESAVDQDTSATTQNQTAKGGRGGRQQMPGQNGQNGQMPQMPGQNGQNTQNGQMPQMPGQNGQNSQNNQNSQNGQQQMPGMGGRNGRQGKGMNGRNGKTGIVLDLDRLLSEGVITQEVYDAINTWVQNQIQNASAPAEGTEPPALPDGTAPAENSEPPAQPDGTADESATAQLELLKSLLDSGVITQEQYDLLVSAIQTPPAAPSET